MKHVDDIPGSKDRVVLEAPEYSEDNIAYDQNDNCILNWPIRSGSYQNAQKEKMI